MGEDVSIFAMLLMGITAILLTLILLAMLGIFFVQGNPPEDTVDQELNVLSGMEEKYRKFKKKEKIKHILGYVVTFFVACFCILYTNLLAAVLGEGPTQIWFVTFLVGILNDFLIIQPAKCLLYYLCTRKAFRAILFDICSGALNVGNSIRI